MLRLRFIAPLVGVFALSACETMQGAGRDMQTAGSVLERQSYNSANNMGMQPQRQPQAGGGAAAVPVAAAGGVPSGAVTDPFAGQPAPAIQY